MRHGITLAGIGLAGIVSLLMLAFPAAAEDPKVDCGTGAWSELCKKANPDCTKSNPVVFGVVGDVMVQGQHVRVVGRCFGAKAGSVRIAYKLPQGGWLPSVKITTVVWHDTSLMFTVPQIQNRGDGKVEFVVIDAKEHFGAPKIVDFRAKALTGPVAVMGRLPGVAPAKLPNPVVVPANRWMVGRVKNRGEENKALELDANGVFHDGQVIRVKTFMLIDPHNASDFMRTTQRGFVVNVNRDCTLQGFNVKPLKGTILKVKSSNFKNTVSGTVAVTYREICSLANSSQHVVGEQSQYLCEAAFQLTTTAICVNNSKP